MSKHRKIRITETVDNFGMYEVDGPVTSLLERCQDLIGRYGPGVSLDYGQHFAYDEGYSFNVRISREETDAEYEKRVGVEFENAAKTERRERKQLVALLKKYGEPT
jgi:hypothetical protein